MPRDVPSKATARLLQEKRHQFHGVRAHWIAYYAHTHRVRSCTSLMRSVEAECAETSCPICWSTRQSLKSRADTRRHQRKFAQTYKETNYTRAYRFCCVGSFSATLSLFLSRTMRRSSSRTPMSVFCIIHYSLLITIHYAGVEVLLGRGGHERSVAIAPGALLHIPCHCRQCGVSCARVCVRAS